MTFFEYLKNIFFILIILQIAPSFIEGIRKQYTRYLETRTKVGLLKVKGILYDSSHYNKYLNKFFKDPSIKAILLKMECPGSAAGTGQAIFNEIQMLKKEYPKPVVVLVENVCASGGYYIACAADYIIAPSSALIGSIGVYFPYFFKLQEFIEQYKIHYPAIKAGKYKTMTDPFVDLTLEDTELMQGLTNDSYQQFTQDVAKTRKLSLVAINEWADGKIFTGRQARKLGLIDEIGSAYNALKVLKEKALIEDKIEWVKPPIKRGLFNFFGGDRAEDNNSMFTGMLNRLCTFFENRYGSKIVY